MNLNSEGLSSPEIPLEYAAITIHVMSLLTLLGVAYQKLVAVLSTKNVAQRMALALTLFTIANQFLVLLSFYPFQIGWLWFLTNLFTYPGQLFYLLFQIYIYNCIRPTQVGSKSNSLLKIASFVTLIVFIAFATPQLLRYSVFNPDLPPVTPTDMFLSNWNKYTFVWPLFAGILDFYLNISMLRIILVNETANIKRGLISICVFVLSMDLAAVFIWYFEGPQTNDFEARTNSAKTLLANSCYCFHAAGGLSYLTFVLSIKRKVVKDTTQTGKFKDSQVGTQKSRFVVTAFEPTITSSS